MCTPPKLGRFFYGKIMNRLGPEHGCWEPEFIEEKKAPVLEQVGVCWMPPAPYFIDSEIDLGPNGERRIFTIYESSMLPIRPTQDSLNLPSKRQEALDKEFRRMLSVAPSSAVYDINWRAEINALKV